MDWMGGARGSKEVGREWTVGPTGSKQAWVQREDESKGKKKKKKKIKNNK